MTNLPRTGQLLIFSNSKHTGFSIQNPSFVSSHRFSLLLSFTNINWTKVPAKSCLYWNTAIYCDWEKAQGATCTGRSSPRASRGHPGCWKPTRHRLNTLLKQQPYLVQETGKTTKKPSSVHSGTQGNVLGIENHKNNQHTHLNPYKPICTEPVKPPMRVSVIAYIWFIFFREISEALQLVPKAQRDGENPQYTKVAALQQHETKQMEKPKIGCDSLSLISMNYLAEGNIFHCNLVAPFPKN